MRSGRVMVTGASGFIGGALVRQLLAAGLEPDALVLAVRSRERALARGLPGRALVVADLSNEATLARAVRGVRAVYHLAGAVVGLSSRDLLRTNGEGTARLVGVVSRHAARCRFVYVSSLAAAGPSIDGSASLVEPERARPISAYGASKLAGEVAVAGAVDLEWIIVRPPVVYGAGDRATALLLRQARGPLALVPWTRRPLSAIHVDDLARALLAAGLADDARIAVPIDGPDRTDTDALTRALALAQGRAVCLVRVPPRLAWPLACAADGLGAVRGRPGFFSRDKLRELCAPGWIADGARARETLGFVPSIALDDGLARTARELGLGAGPS